MPKKSSLGKILAVGAVVTGLGVAIVSYAGAIPMSPLSIAVNQSMYYVGDTLVFATTGLSPPITITIFNTSLIGNTTGILYTPAFTTTQGSFVVSNNLIGTNYLVATDSLQKTAQSGAFSVPPVRPFGK